MKRNPLSRLLSVLLCLCLVAGMLPAALAEEGKPPIQGLDSSVEIEAGSSKMMDLSLSPANEISGVEWECNVDQSNTGISASFSGNRLTISVANDVADKTTANIQVTATYTESAASPDPGSRESEGGEDTPGDAQAEPTKKTVQGSCTVTVKNTPADIKVTDVKLTATSTSLNLTTSKTTTLTAAITPEDATNNSVTWSVSGDAVALDNHPDSLIRTVTAVKGGTATVTVTAKDGSGKSDSVEIQVEDNTPVSVESVSLSKTSTALTVGTSETLTAKVLPTNATNQSVTWSSSNSNIATVSSNGLVTAKAAGTAVITVTTQDGKKTATCTVTVNPSGVPTISNTSLTLNVNKSSNLTISNLPTGATVTWSTANSSIAKLSTTTGTSITVTGVTVGGPVRVTATVKNGSAVTATLFCDVTVTAGSPAAINKTVKADGTLTLNASDFNSVCTGVYGASLSHVRFSSNSVSAGTLYYGYTQKDGGAKIDTGRDYSASTSGSRRISDITFVPSGRGGETATFSYTATDVNGKTYAGQLIITIESPSGNVKYETAKDEPVDFDSGDFDDICRSITGSRLDYVTFTLPSSSRGTLYYDYGGKDEEKLSSSDKCYADEDDGDFGLDGITFVPKSGYTGTVTFNYSGRSTSKDSFSGTVTITISKTGSTLRYEIDENEELELDDSDFNDYCKDQTGSNLDYVTFDLPSSSRGTLYYKYGKSGEDDISSSDKFYRSSSPRLDDVTFVPKSGYTGTLSIDFSGRSVDGGRFTGTVKIEVGGNGGDISYSAASGSPVRFNLSDFNDLCQDETDERLDYVTFTLPSSSRGTLYYKYGQSGEDKISSSDKFYRSGTPSLADVSFVPASGFTGTLEIDFSGRSTDNDRFSGTVSITYTAVKDPSVIRYSSNGGAVTFRSSDFVSACAARDAGSLVSVMFNTPASGTLYYGYNSPTSYGGVVAPRVSFGTGSGSSSISGVTYVPKAGYSGTEVLTYTGTDNKGATFTGTVSITVTPVTTSQFTDMGNYSWAAASVDFLYKNGITTGTSDTTYGPAGNITRGDFVLMLARAFQLSGGDVSNSFSDVPANSYYAQAIASAKALGIAQGGGSTFNPTGALTRQDAMVLLHRTLSRTGRTIPDASSTYLSRFTDGSNVSSYAQGSVAALVQAGVIQGDTSGRLNPQGSLTRAEMAVILHRVLTL